MTSPVRSAASANGTMAFRVTSSIARYAPRTAWTSWLLVAVMSRAMYATTAPIQPTEVTRWTVSINLRRPGAMVTNGRSTAWPGERRPRRARSEEHTSELQSLLRISYAVFCLKKKKINITKQAQYTETEQ